jgi:hypothetical protein
LHADWLDENEDLIQTDRRDILWAHELGQKFEEWGQAVVRKIGTRSRDPMKKKTWDRFKEISKLEARVRKAFPRDDQEALREQAMTVAKLIGQTMRTDEVEDPVHVESFVQLSLMLAPVITLDEKLRAAADAGESQKIAFGLSRRSKPSRTIRRPSNPRFKPLFRRRPGSSTRSGLRSPPINPSRLCAKNS